MFCGIDFDYITMALVFMTMQHRKQTSGIYISLAAHVWRQSRKREHQLFNSEATNLVRFMVTILTFCKIYSKG